MDAETIGMACVELGVGRKVVGEKIDATAGIEMFVRIGDKVKAGDPLCRFFSNTESKLEPTEKMLGGAIAIGETAPELLPLVAKVLS